MVSLITLSDLTAQEGKKEPPIYLKECHVTDRVIGTEY